MKIFLIIVAVVFCVVMLLMKMASDVDDHFNANKPTKNLKNG